MTYIQSRLAMIQTGEKPDPSGFQDGAGRSRKWTKVRVLPTGRYAPTFYASGPRYAYFLPAVYPPVPIGRYTLTSYWPLRVSQEEMEGTDKSWSIFQPRTWWYGGYVPAGGYAQADVSSSAL